MKNFLKDLLSVEEHKTSCMIIAFFLILIMGLWKTYRFGDFPSNLMGVLEFLAGTIGAVNVTSRIVQNQQPIPMDSRSEVKK